MSDCTFDGAEHDDILEGVHAADVRAGAEAALPRLQALAHDLFIHDVALFDAVSATVRPHQSVVVSGNISGSWS